MNASLYLLRILLLFYLAFQVSARAGENAAPSSHFVFDDNFEGDIIINEVRVPKDGEALYTYYEALGWRGNAAGYAGIQAHPKAHNYIFSIWDHKSHTAPIKAVYRDPGTKTEKFGGEGTGLKSWNFELGWDTDTWYTLVSRCWPVADHTFFGYWVHSAKTKKWTHMVTMDVATKAAYFKGRTDAFIEDWLETGKNARTTHLRGGWKRKPSGEWHAFSGGRYSVNHWDLVPGKRSFNFKNNWNGGVAEDASGPFYFMVSGGADTKPTVRNPSEHAIARKEKKKPPPHRDQDCVSEGGDRGGRHRRQLEERRVEPPSVLLQTGAPRRWGRGAGEERCYDPSRARGAVEARRPAVGKNTGRQTPGRRCL